MEFDILLKKLIASKSQALPGEKAQLLLSPMGRAPKDLAIRQADKIRHSAVLVFIYPKNEHAHISLIKRNVYAGVHSAQVSFPGGKKEATDTSFLHTALREAEEEIGLNPNDIRVVKALSELFIPPSQFLVKPFLSYSEMRPRFEIDPREVQALIEFPVATLLNEASLVDTLVESTYLNSKIKTKAFQYEEHLVWGATAMILSELKEMLRA